MDPEVLAAIVEKALAPVVSNLLQGIAASTSAARETANNDDVEILATPPRKASRVDPDLNPDPPTPQQVITDPSP